MVDKELLSELYDQVQHGPKRRNLKTPDPEQLSVLKEFYGKVSVNKLARTLGISDRLVTRWYKEYVQNELK